MSAVKTLMSLLVSCLLLGTQMVFTAVPVLDASCAKTVGCGCCDCPTKQCCMGKSTPAPAPAPGIPPPANERIDLQGLAMDLAPLLEPPAANHAQTSFSVFYSVAVSVPLYIRDCAYLI